MNGTLAPWDQLPYFDKPLEVHYAVGPGTVRILPANQRRVAFLVSVTTAAAPIQITMDQNAGASAGLYVASFQTLAFTNGDFGPLTQQEWFAIVGGLGADFTVVEVLLKDWPHIRWDKNDRVTP